MLSPSYKAKIQTFPTAKEMPIALTSTNIECNNFGVDIFIKVQEITFRKHVVLAKDRKPPIKDSKTRI